MAVVTASSPISPMPQVAAPRLSPGEVVAATVLGMVDASTARLQLPSGVLTVPTDAALVPGTRVEVTIGGTAAHPTATVTSVLANAPPQPAAQAPGPLSAQQVAASIVGDAAARQNGLAPLYADLTALMKSGQPLPAPVVAIARQLLAAPLDATSKQTVSAGEIKAALMQSGLVAGEGGANAPPQTQLTGLNLALGLMRRALTAWRDDEQVETAPAKAGLGAAVARAAMDVRQAPPPPFRNGPTVAQAPVAAALPDEVAGLTLAQHLLDRTEAAIARQTLLQVASLPDGDAPAAKPGADGRHLLFDIPMTTPQGTAVAQFRIERDGAGSETEAGKPAWRASFAIDIEPLGRVNAHIALVGGRTSVTLRAERADSAALFNDHLAQLEASLRDADLEPGTLACTNAAAAAPPTAAQPGMFLDSKT